MPAAATAAVSMSIRKRSQNAGVLIVQNRYEAKRAADDGVDDALLGASGGSSGGVELGANEGGGGGTEGDLHTASLLRQASQRAVAEVREQLVERGATGTHPWVVLPDVWWMGYWDAATGLSLVFTALVTPYEVAMLATEENPLFYLNRFIDLIFYIDIGLAFFAAFRRNAKQGGSLVTSLPTIRRNYLTGWFLIDISSMIPLDTVGVVQARMANDDGEGGGGASSFKGLRLMKLLKLMKLVRLVKARCRSVCVCVCVYARALCRCCCRVALAFVTPIAPPACPRSLRGNHPSVVRQSCVSSAVSVTPRVGSSVVRRRAWFDPPQRRPVKASRVFIKLESQIAIP